MSQFKRKSLKRRAPTRSPTKIVHIYTEGKLTEPDYLEALWRQYPHDERKLKIYKGAGVAKTVADKAIKHAKNRTLNGRRQSKKINSYEGNDVVWAVFDRDLDRTSGYPEAVSKCKSANVNYAYSDPCFELWLNLHFGNYDAPDDRHKVQSITEGLIQGYDKKKNKSASFENLVDNCEAAENRAQVQRTNRYKEGNKDGTRSTSVYKLTKFIRTDLEEK